MSALKTPRLRRIVPLLALAAVCLPAASSADTQPVTGTTINVLGIASTPVVLSNLAPGQTATGVGTTTVTSTGAWVLRLSDTATGNPGHLLRTSGSSGATSLASALQWATSPSLGGTGGSGTLTGSTQVAASGTLSDVVTTTYSQPVAATEQLATGSIYSVTVTWTVSPT